MKRKPYHYKDFFGAFPGLPPQAFTIRIIFGLVASLTEVGRFLAKIKLWSRVGGDARALSLHKAGFWII